MSIKKGIKIKHLIPKDKTMSRDKFVYGFIEKHSTRMFNSFAKKHSINSKKLKDKFKEVFKSSDYLDKDVDGFGEVLWDTVLKPVLISEGIEVIE